MNKYIRTKDGNIYEYANVMLSQLIDTDILKESDTIEELCDLFVYCIIRCEHIMTYERFKTLKQAIKWVKKNDEELTCIKGAIWTDKGLIYVAKLNDKGELELL